ncbi:amidohydrolase family protein, partial [Amycolatopsis sp. SID8362]|uniref:amidohydrolase family protein n=1 Tax=Amycolatopsis sp. SID8362 TaxID=2690346 RepID=UPI00136CAEB6
MATTAITGAQVFDGEKPLGVRTVVLDGRKIRQVGGEVPDGAEVVDGRGATLLPGLIDAHVHSAPGSQALALRFGVTTELEMQGLHTRENRAHITEDDTVADIRSSGFAITPPGGHPSELMPEGFRPGGDLPPVMPLMPFSTTPEEAAAFVPQLLARGSDYIKFMIDDGSVEGHPGLPMLDQATLNAGVAEAKKHGALTVAHALTVDATRMAAEAGIDGLVHVFMDRPHTAEIVDLVAEAGMFVVPCVALNASMMGITGGDLADDPRVARRLDGKWAETLRSSYDRYPQGKLEDVLATVGALAEAGVDILAGTDASMAETFFGGLAHGASLHQELGYLVAAGLTPAQALRAATATTARRFGLGDRGRIAEGLR